MYGARESRAFRSLSSMWYGIILTFKTIKMKVSANLLKSMAIGITLGVACSSCTTYCPDEEFDSMKLEMEKSEQKEAEGKEAYTPKSTIIRDNCGDDDYNCPACGLG